MTTELVTKSVGINSYENLDGLEIVSAVARHGKVKEDNGKLIKFLMKHKHWSPLQHIFFGFKVTTSRAISAQIFRHRSLNFQETSQRYEEIPGYETIELRMEHPTNRQSSTDVFDPRVTLSDGEGAEWDETASDAIASYLAQGQKIYAGLIAAGVSKECARFILPMASTTTIHISGTLRDLLGFINVRADSHTQKEARDIAIAIGREIERELPSLFNEINWEEGMFM
jgi:thymidylate synthase (FAD)